MTLENCRICPRECGADRTQNESGYCLTGEEIFLARAALHYWEEPCISGTRGSGAVFFCGCNLHCIYCQNGSISSMKEARKVTSERLTEIFLELQEQGAENINLVTPGHYVPQIAGALCLAKEQGLFVPVVYNTGSYEYPETLKRMEGLVDIYLPDFKYMSSTIADRYSNAPDYAFHAKAAVREMVRQVKKPEFDERGMMKQGVIVRHLALPGCMEDSKKIIKYLYETYGDDIYISIMNQYTPMPGIADQFPELGRCLSREDYDKLVDYAISLGVENGFIQEGETAKESFIPPFDLEGV